MGDGAAAADCEELRARREPRGCVGGDPKTAPGIEPVIGDLGDRLQLRRILERLNGSRALVLELAAEEVLPPICVRAAERRLTPRDLVQLELLRKGLDGIAPPRAWEETG